jgi:hypothetical protein
MTNEFNIHTPESSPSPEPVGVTSGDDFLNSKIGRIAETILILCNVPVVDVKPLSYEWARNKNLWSKITLEDWLLSKGYEVHHD